MDWTDGGNHGPFGGKKGTGRGSVEMDWTDGGNHGPFGGKKGTGRGSVEWARQDLCFGDG
jgi:hypothetical protein